MKTKRGIIVLITLFSIITINYACKDKPKTEDPKPVIPVEPVELKVDTLLNSLSNPWGLTFLPDGSILITERIGKLLRYYQGNVSEISGLPAIETAGQAGLMDITLHPNYASNGWIYFTASVKEGAGMSTALFRAKLNGATLDNVTKLFQADPKTSSTAHFGSRIVFDAQNHVYVCFGERNDPPQAQVTSNHSGTVVRLNDDGTVPTDNPFVGNAAFKPEIWSYGHRNPQGMAVHPQTGTIWLHEHGPKGGDEINIIGKGNNYGWPLATFGVNYNGSSITPDTFVAGTVLPTYYWVPSIAPCGMTFYDSDVIPQWKGNLFLGALAGQHLNRLEIIGEKIVKEERLLQNMARFRAVKQGPDGYLYFVTETPGYLGRYRPKG
jgi:glucose/arabinose dehydrogenase